MRAQTEKTTFTCKDDFLLTKRTRRWTYSALLYFFYTFSELPGIQFKENIEGVYAGWQWQ